MTLCTTGGEVFTGERGFYSYGGIAAAMGKAIQEFTVVVVVMGTTIVCQARKYGVIFASL